jgi:single-strand DNA-binding protein
MRGVNKVILLGIVGRDPKIDRTTSGVCIAKFSLATNDSYKKESGETIDTTEWHQVTFYGALAETCEKYLKKGAAVFIEGKIKTSKWKDKEGNDRSLIGINGYHLQFVDKKSDTLSKDEATTDEDNIPF